MPKAHPSPSWFGLSLAVAVIAGMALACGGSTSVPPVPATGSTLALPTVPDAEPSTEAEVPTQPPPPLPTPEPPTPEAPAYKEPVLMAEFGGTGSVVSDNYNLPACDKAVFEWSVNKGSYGSASLILNLHRVGSEDVMTLVNEAVFENPTDTLSGSGLQPLLGGEYYFSSENTDEAWTVRAVCRDGEKPVGEAIDLSGTGVTVTGNYTLHACQKSVFTWTTKASSIGSASIAIYLCGARCELIANEFKMDVADSISGEVVQAVDNRDYYLYVENLSANTWTVKWECRD